MAAFGAHTGICMVAFAFLVLNVSSFYLKVWLANTVYFTGAGLLCGSSANRAFSQHCVKDSMPAFDASLKGKFSTGDERV